MVALDLLISQIQHVRDAGRMPAREVLLQKPAFIDRGSVGPAPDWNGKKKNAAPR